MRLQVISQLKTFLFAGHDTTASLIAWATYFVSRNPQVEQKLLKEVDAAFAATPGERDTLSSMSIKLISNHSQSWVVLVDR